MFDKKQVYLDNGASTKVDPKVLEKMKPYFTDKYGNPASLHKKGKQSKKAVTKSRKTIAKSIGAKKKEIVFTSGETESDNYALKRTAYVNRGRGKTYNYNQDRARRSLKILRMARRPRI